MIFPRGDEDDDGDDHGGDDDWFNFVALQQLVLYGAEKIIYLK